MKGRLLPAAVLLFSGLACAFPFLHRAYFVDDHYFVTIAKHIAEHPARPYDFRSDDERPQTVGWERGHPPRMVNPLLFHYYLAAVIRIFGEDVWKLRLSTLVFSTMASVSMYFLGFRFGPRPFYPALLMSLTPAYWLTSYSLLIDSMMLGCLLCALWSFMAALERRSLWLIVLSGMLMGATLLTKYSGALVLVLAFFWQVLHPAYRRWRPGYFSFAICLAILASWSVWNIYTYGTIHLFASAARGVKADESTAFYLYKALAVGSFLGGGSLFLLVTPFLIWRFSRLAAVTLSIFGFILTWFFMSRAGGFSASQGIQLAIWISVAFGFVLLLVLQRWPKSLTQRFLYVWFLIGSAELVVVMPWTAGRYLLILLPPVVWLFDHWLTTLKLDRWRWPLLLATACGSFLIASSDQAQANVIFDLSKRLSTKDCFHNGCYYLGDTFSAYPKYLGPYGWRAGFPEQAYRPGDIIVIAHYRLSAWWRLPDRVHLRSMGSVSYPSNWPVRVMDVPNSAGWYASCWGALPFILTKDPLERYDFYQVTA